MRILVTRGVWAAVIFATLALLFWATPMRGVALRVIADVTGGFMALAAIGIIVENTHIRRTRRRRR